MKYKFSKPGGKTRVFVICLVTALVFWFFNALHAPSERQVVLPVSYRAMPVSVRVIDSLPREVTVWVEGRGFGFLSADLAAMFQPPGIDLSGLRADDLVDTSRLSLSVRDLLKPRTADLPEHLRILRTAPDSIGISFTGHFSKRVPVFADLNMQFRQQYMLDDKVTVRPDSVEISGTPEALDKVHFIRTAPLVIRDLHRNTRTRLSLRSGNKRIRMAQNDAEVDIPVSEYAEGKVNIAITGPTVEGRQLVILPSSVQLTYRSPVERFKEIGPMDFTVNMHHFSASPRRRNKSAVVASRIPEQVTVTSISPPWVEYYFLN